ncbi:MAG TPA: ABC transporter ATP-binding protein [Thermoanaerobaculia bacterium]|nr:ABC transporter ATP-binding protein [Thermoanaerobaculia bacterium]
MFFEVEGLTKRFGGLTAVADVSFAIAQGEIVGVFGPNGSGKTTLLNLIAGIYAPSEGRLVFKDRMLRGAKPHELAALGIVKTFQNPQLFAELSVAEHVLIADHLKLKRALGAGRIATLLNRHLGEHALGTEVERVLALCRLGEIRDERAASLSYGNEKMLGVAMALMCEPELLLLDEPATGLGEDEIRNLDGVLRALRAHGTTLCIIDHKVGFLSTLADRAIAMHHGSKIAEGPPAAVLEDPDVVAAYLGRGHA